MAGDPDDWTFDDDFVRGGRHEPAARTRDAIARHGGERTSWRHPGSPVAERQGRRHRPREGRGPRTGRRKIVFAALVAGVIALGAWAVVTGGHSDAPVAPLGAPLGASEVPTISADRTSPSGTTTAGPDDSVTGLDEATPVGTCFTAPANEVRETYRGSLQLDEVDCATAHYYELVAHANAANSSSYPADTYWNGPVTRSCARALAGYAGARAHGVPRVDGRSASFFRPRVAGWAQGDRAVYCMAMSALPHTASVRGR